MVLLCETVEMQWVMAKIRYTSFAVASP